MFNFFKWLLHRYGLRFDGQTWYDSLKLVHAITHGTLEAHILEDPKPCGHVRYYVDLIDTHDRRPLYIGMFEQDMITPSVDLLRTANDFIRNYHEHG